jgi:hypothetical protein
MDAYAKEVEDFRFLPLKEEWGADYKKQDHQSQEGRRLRVTIGINGWLTSKEDVTKPWRVLGDDSEVFALRYEMDSLLRLGLTLEELVKSYAWNFVKMEILKRTVLATLWAALWPAYLLSVAAQIDNPFNLARNRSQKAGRVLADALINKVQGERPVTLVGYSLGARVIYSCLRSLAQRKAFGLVDTVVLIGAPVPSNPAHWQMLRSVVSGKIFNVYSQNDYILAFLYRATSLQLGIAGLQNIKDIDGVENLDLSEEVAGHLRYPELLAKILTRCGFESIKGGEGPIEKDEDVGLQLKDMEAGERTGTLIHLQEFGDPEKREGTGVMGKRPGVAKTYSDELRLSMGPPKVQEPLHDPDPNSGARPSNPNRTTVSRTSSTLVSDETNPLADLDEGNQPPVSTRPEQPMQTEPSPALLGPKDIAAQAFHSTSHQKRPGISNSEHLSTRSTNFTTNAPPDAAREDIEEDPDDDEEEWVGIKMVINDSDDDGEMVQYMEPLRIHD